MQPVTTSQQDAERRRLREVQQGVRWYRWGPYLSARQWGTVREDYSADGDAWNCLTHDESRSRAYRWGEDGLLGICDNKCLLCFAVALWNENDPILKERPFGLTNPEGNHGEDVKEYYYFLDNTPSHSYMKGLYKYPQRAFPYGDLVEVNRQRSRREPEYELLDTGVFDQNRYFDVVVEYAKAAPEDLVVRISATNRGPEAAPLHLLPTLWFRNTWAWGWHDYRPELCGATPSGQDGGSGAKQCLVRVEHRDLGVYWLLCEGAPALLFTENESNAKRLWNAANHASFVKDGIHDAVVHGEMGAVNPAGRGTKVSAHYAATIATGATETVTLRLCASPNPPAHLDAGEVLGQRRAEADQFYASLGAGISEEGQRVYRQALAGLLWSKQFYHYDVRRWLDGDPAGPPPPAQRRWGRNADWRTLTNSNIISMPDTWEYPWYAAWDLGFHCVTMALVDPDAAKRQLITLTREWYMNPGGQIPAYEWAFSDVNPPVEAWAALQVFRVERSHTGRGDRAFLERIFHKLMLNFTWWVNRKDRDGRNVFQGGFLGLDNIGVFDRNAPLPTGGYLEQADGTAWMGMFCLNMLAIALELAREDSVYEDIATKFFEHFLYIAGALNDIGGEGVGLWDEEDEFFYDVVRLPDEASHPLKVRSMVGLIPLLAVMTIDSEQLKALPSFAERLEWFLTHRTDLGSLVSHWDVPGEGNVRLLALVRGHRMKCLLKRMLDPAEFLSDYGVRSLSRYHLDQPYILDLHGTRYEVAYLPAESDSGLFGGNSNWRGPIWCPLNYLLIDALRRFHAYYRDDFLVECPAGTGNKLTLSQIADFLARRLIAIYLPGPDGRRPVNGGTAVMQEDPHWRDHLLFYEYFHGDNGAGIGASHQTGWTALVANLLDETRSRE